MTETEDFNVTEIRCSDLHPVDPDSTISGQAHATAVNQFLESEGLSDGKKKRKRFLRMSPEAFAVFRLNNAIAKFCKVVHNLHLQLRLSTFHKLLNAYVIKEYGY